MADKERTATVGAPRRPRRPVHDEPGAALARLEAAAETARAAGRPLTARAAANEVRDTRARRWRLIKTIRVSRDCVAYQIDDPDPDPAD